MTNRELINLSGPLSLRKLDINLKLKNERNSISLRIQQKYSHSIILKISIYSVYKLSTPKYSENRLICLLSVILQVLAWLYLSFCFYSYYFFLFFMLTVKQKTSRISSEEFTNTWTRQAHFKFRARQLLASYTYWSVST